VANGADDTVSVIDTATNTVVATITVGAGPRGIAITPDGVTVYVTNQEANTVTPIDTATNTAGTPIPVGANPRGIAIGPDPPAPPPNPPVTPTTPTTPQTTAAPPPKDPKCKRLRRKLKRWQARKLARALLPSKIAQIQGNIRDTQGRLKKLGC
jgi:YVTN family beta-propeller protein